MTTAHVSARPYITGFLVLPQSYLDELFDGVFATPKRRKVIRRARRRTDSWTRAA